MSVMLEFSGGLEILFSGCRRMELNLSDMKQIYGSVTLANLVTHICSRIQDGRRKDMFVVEDEIRPGILVLINESDWELEGGTAYTVKPGDQILFVSTLHGG